MHDFIGQKIHVGNWVATSGGGNGPAEYGMILYRVIEVGHKLKLQRLTVSYAEQGQRCLATVRTITSVNPNKYVIVHPPDPVEQLFMRITEGHGNPEDHRKVGLWLHGQRNISWE